MRTFSLYSKKGSEEILSWVPSRTTATTTISYFLDIIEAEGGGEGLERI